MNTTKKVNSNTIQIFGRTIGRNEILARYWELGSIDPASTKDGMTGQLNALSLLWEGLVLQPAEVAPLKPNIYRASWLPDSPNKLPS
jgi:hypothetical protein